MSPASFTPSNPLENGASRDAPFSASKMQQKYDPRNDVQRLRNLVPRQKAFPVLPCPSEEVGQASYHSNPSVNRRYKDNRDSRPRFCPPRMQRREIESRAVCSPSPVIPCASDPCCPMVSCPKNESLSAQLKQEVFAALQKPPPLAIWHNTSAPASHVTIEKTRNSSSVQPPAAPVPSKDAVSTRSQSVPFVAEQRDMTLLSPPTHRSRGHEEASRRPEVVSLAPADLGVDALEKPNVSLPAPPGLSKPSGRNGRGWYGYRGKDSAKRADAQHSPNHIQQDINFELYNSPVAPERVITPPLTNAIPNAVKLPPRNETQPVLSSPTISNSSVSEDMSGGSFTNISSDTTLTSVNSSLSEKDVPYSRRPREICRNWSKGLPCFWVPCRYLHEQQNQHVNSAIRPRPSSTVVPQPSVTTTPIHTSERKSDRTSGSHDPPSRNVEPHPKSAPLYVATVSDHIKVRFDQGFEVREVVTGFESRWVHLGNIDGTVTSAALNKLLAPYNVDNVNLPDGAGKPVTAKVQFPSSANAIKAVTELNGTDFAGRKINAKLAINNSRGGNTVLNDTDVQLLWQCPSRVGYAGYDTLKEAKAAIDSLHGFALGYSVVSAQLYEGLPCVGAYNVIFKHLPADVTEQSLRKFASSKAVMLGRPNYQSLDNAVKSIRSRLEEYGNVAFDVIPPPYKDGLVKGWAHFTSPAEARAAQEDFDHRRPGAIGHTSITCRHMLSVSHALSAASYRRMREDIGWLRWSWQRRYGPSISIIERVKDTEVEAPAFIKLSSEQPELLSHLKYEFEQLLHGETITLDRKPLWDEFLITPAGFAYIEEVQLQYPGVEIQIQKNRRVVSLWGPIVMRHRARQDIVRKVMELNAMQYWKIPLSGKLLGIFCSAELSSLQGLLGSGNCILDFAERVLVVRGNDHAYRTACDAVESAQKRQGHGSPSSGAICPVCFSEAAVPVSLACGHRWCRACLTGYLTSAVENKMFPLQCLGNDATCTQCIPLGLARKLLSAADFDAVIEAAFWVYVHSRPDEFHNCPTPDCTQVYRTTPQNAVLQCPSCLVRICAACRIEYHDGMTCEERDVAEDKLFKEWTSNHDVKSCPGCRAPIERSEGCNHMTCTRCQTHSCWECLATFPRGQGIYEHMRVQHGSIGL